MTSDKESRKSLHRDSFAVARIQVVDLIYFGVVIAAACWIVWSAHAVDGSDRSIRWTSPDWTPSFAARFVWIVGVLLLAIVPFYPPVGLLVYIALMIGFARYTPELGFIYQSRLPEIVLGITLLGWILWNKRQRNHYVDAVPTTAAGKILLCFLIWVIVVSCVAVFSSNYWPPDIHHDPTKFVDAGIAFFVSAACLARRKEYLIVVTVLAIALVVRESIWSDLTHLDGDISSLLVITIPLVLGAASVVERWPAKLAYLLGTGYLTWLVYLTQNRGAGIALVVSLLVIWLNSRRKLVVLAIALPLLVGASAWFRHTDYWERFQKEIYSNGAFVGSARSRLDIWEASWRAFQERPILGSGPGSVSKIIGADPQIGHYVAHNSYLETLVETGLPGLALYLAFFGAVVFAAWRTARSSPPDWRSRLSKYLLASLAAYFACSVFISRQDLVLAYIIAGIVVAMASETNRSAIGAVH